MRPDTDPDTDPCTYAYDPCLDPQLQWAGKAEHASFEVPTLSLHIHERSDPRTIVEAVHRRPDPATPVQLSLFQTPEENGGIAIAQQDRGEFDWETKAHLCQIEQ